MEPSLNNDQLYQLTKYKQGKRQAEWLERELGIKPPIDKDGHPCVSQYVIDQATLARRRATAAAPPEHGESGPKWRVAV